MGESFNQPQRTSKAYGCWFVGGLCAVGTLKPSIFRPVSFVDVTVKFETIERFRIGCS